MKQFERTIRFVVALGFCLPILASCQRPRSHPSETAPPASADSASYPTTTQPTFDEIYERTSRVFAKAVLWKPDEDNSESSLIPLAPLVVQEVENGGGPADELAFYADADCQDSLKDVDQNCPTICCTASTTRIRGISLRQLTFCWEYRAKSKEYASAVQCAFRMTLDEKGFPLLWEVLGAPGSRKEIYVSHRLETMAAAEFGPPLAGRRFSIERSTDEQPNVVVPRVLADGPVPMGPYVYLSAVDHEVTTLACRCMESQVRDFSATRGYRLSSAELMSGDQLCKGTLKNLPRTRRTISLKSTPLDQVLRLPDRLFEDVEDHSSAAPSN